MNILFFELAVYYYYLRFLYKLRLSVNNSVFFEKVSSGWILNFWFQIRTRALMPVECNIGWFFLHHLLPS